jgi:nucleoside 2-deoxyribosyltransferase
VKLVYIAGAFNAGPKSIRENVFAAELAGISVAGCGAMPVVPHSITVNMISAQTEAFWYAGTAELLRRCDAVYVFDVAHVETSKGTRAEVDLANSLGLPVFIDLEALRRWVQMHGMREVTPLVAREPIEAGQLVALHPDGTVGPAR